MQAKSGGWSDCGLTDVGRRQASLLAARLRRELVDTPCGFYASDLKRAWQTAQVIAQATGLTPAPEPGLSAFNNGIAAGMTAVEARKHFVPRTDPALDWRPYPGAESWRQFYHRVEAAIARLAMSEAEVLLLVTHSGAIVAITLWWLQLGVEKALEVAFDSSPASLPVLRQNRWSERTIERLNDTAHLQAAGLASPMRLDSG
jgi:probable phosphoglycerate mutase